MDSSLCDFALLRNWCIRRLACHGLALALVMSVLLLVVIDYRFSVYNHIHHNFFATE